MTPSRRRVLFVAVGLLNTAVDLGLFLLLHGPLGLVAATVLSTSAGMLVSFVLNGRVTFGAERSTPRQAVTFLLVNAVVFWGLQPWVVVGVVHLLGGGSDTATALAGKVVGTLASAVATWFAYRHLVWREPTTAPARP